MAMIKSHPTEKLLLSYVTGDLSPAMLVMVGTHVDMCQQCQHHMADMQEQLALKTFGSKTDVQELNESTSDFMLEAIFNSSQPIVTATPAQRDFVSLDGKRFQLPATLARNSRHIGEWQHMVSKLWRAPVKVGDDQVLNLVYMGEGAQVPEHTHKGHEATLVINGVFHDEYDEYSNGDFVLLDSGHKHTPQTQAEDCLTLATLDAPMQFTSGISRLLNPFSSLFFR